MKTIYFVTKSRINEQVFGEESDTPDPMYKGYYTFNISQGILVISYLYPVYVDDPTKFVEINTKSYKQGEWFLNKRQAIAALIEYKQKEAEKITQKIFELSIQLKNESSSNTSD